MVIKKPKEIFCSGEKLWLSAHRAVYWQKEKMLIVADLHLGKTAYFRNKGIAIPSSVMVEDLKRLSALINEFNPDTLLVIGDMFHHNYNADIELFSNWCQQLNGLRIKLVPGNHDRLLEIEYEKLCIDITSLNYIQHAFLFTHEMKRANTKYFTLSGHLHPGYAMEGKGKQALRLPCFIKSNNHLVLPAFSAFTGLYVGYEKQDDHQYYVIAGNAIYEM